MRILIIAALVMMPLSAWADDAPVTRRDGFLTMWQSLRRPVQRTNEQPFTDVPEGDEGFAEITYAKARGILDDNDARFHPDDPLMRMDALLWLLRMRSVDDITAITYENLPVMLERYPLRNSAGSTGVEMLESLAGGVSENDLLSFMRTLDETLASQSHEVSLYAEKFHGKGTAFGEAFDMHALTAAHRTYPHNTLVRVTNVANDKSVVVRINDRGPYVEGRDMDLSLAAFTAIANRSLGVIRARFERLGDVSIANDCGSTSRFQQRLARDVRLQRGIPHTFSLGGELLLRANRPFVVRSVRYPDGVLNSLQDWVPTGEQFTFKPSMAGAYVFRIGTLDGRHRTMTMRVVECAR